YYNLGRALRQRRRTDESIATLQRAIELPHTPPDALVELGYALRDQARLDEAIEAFRRGLDGPLANQAYDGLLYTLWFRPDVRPEEVVDEHRRWAQRFADPLTAVA